MTVATTPATDTEVTYMSQYAERCVDDHYVEITKAELLSLIARIHQEREKAEWQPIETAPKDGTKVDLWAFWPEGSESKRSTDCYWVSGDKEWSFGRWSESSYVHRPVITHWRPLPAPPALSQEERT